MKLLSIRNAHLLLATLMLTAYFIETGGDNLFSFLLMFLVTMSPIPVNMIAAAFSKTRAAQIILLCATVAYSAWAILLYTDVQNSADGQAGIVLLATAIAAMPVLIPLWITCLIIEIRHKRRAS